MKVDLVMKSALKPAIRKHIREEVVAVYEGKKRILRLFINIFDTIEKIESFTHAISFEAFAEDKMRVFAVVRALENYGRSSEKCSNGFKIELSISSLERDGRNS
jgi:hypothetical protein